MSITYARHLLNKQNCLKIYGNPEDSMVMYGREICEH